jgi:hypothetical protein
MKTGTIQCPVAAQEIRAVHSKGASDTPINTNAAPETSLTMGGTSILTRVAESGLLSTALATRIDVIPLIELSDQSLAPCGAGWRRFFYLPNAPASNSIAVSSRTFLLVDFPFKPK